MELIRNLKLVISKVFPSEQALRVRPWFQINGDKTLRLDYDLNENSIVFDLGGYEGQWSSDIFSKYCSSIYIFEPVPMFAEQIRNRFIKNHKLKVFAYGLASSNREEQISLLKDGSTIYNKKAAAQHLDVQFRNIGDFLSENNVKKIDLMKINIEGGEYDLLENLINTGRVGSIDNIQIQFHDFVPNAKERMKEIQFQLMKTHELTYHYEFVWENWKKKRTSDL